MKTEQQIKEELAKLLLKHSPSANMNYERSGAIEALEWVLSDTKNYLGAGERWFEVKVMTKGEWLDKGRKLFGPDISKWRFVCPICKNVASVDDYRQYKSQGATPESATHNCIGRYTENPRRAFGDNPKETPEKPCDYSGYGLFNFCPVEVIEGAEKHHCFAFDE